MAFTNPALEQRREQLLGTSYKPTVVSKGTESFEQRRQQVIAQGPKSLVPKVQVKKTDLVKAPPVESPKSIFMNIQNSVTNILNKGKRVISDTRLREGDAPAAQVGRLLQKFPDTTIRVPKKYKSEGLYDEIVEFVSGLPVSLAQSYGKDLELLSTPEGKKQLKKDGENLPKTIREVKTHIDNKEWGKAFETAFSNSALVVALDVADFIPVAGIVGFGLKKGGRALLKQVVKEGIEEAEEKVTKSAVIYNRAKEVKKPISEADESLLTSEQAIEQATKDTPHKKAVREEIQSIQEDQLMRRQDNEAKKSILEQFSSKEIQAMRTLKKSIGVAENKGLDPTSVSSLPSYKQHIYNIMSAIGTNSEDEALRYIREDLPDALTRTTSREELAKLKVLKSHIAPGEKIVPRSQLPVGEGKLKVSRLEARIKKSLDDVSEENIEKLGLSNYQQMNKKENIRKAAEYVTNNPREALDVLSGKVEAPKGVLYNSIFVAMQNEAKGDVDLARKLASLQSTRFGQELSILTELDPDSPVKAMSEVVKIREEAFRKRHTGKTVKEVSDKVVADIKKKVKVPDKYDWSHFLDSIQC